MIVGLPPRLFAIIVSPTQPVFASPCHIVCKPLHIRVDDPEHRRGSQEDLGPVLMGREETKKPGAFGELGKQRPIVARQPAIERTVASAFERMQHPQGHYFTRPQGGVGDRKSVV